MRSSLALVASISSLALAQSFFSTSDVPACAQSCTNLVNAQAACPPTVNQAATCFCNSNYLVSLLSAPQTVCPTCTAQSDLSQLTGWFNQFCKEGGSTTWSPSGASTAPPASSATAAPAASTTAASNPAATTAPAGDGTQDTGDDSGDGTVTTAAVTDHRSWWDKHKGWIAMVIVLVIGFAAIIAGGVWWKKRYLRKKNAAGATLPGAWGPSDGRTATFTSEHVEKYGGTATTNDVSGGILGGSTKQKIVSSLRRS